MDLPAVSRDALSHAGHLCFPYESEEEKQRTLVTFVADGVARRERCVFIGSADEQDALVAALGAAGVAVERALERTSLVLASPGETYFRTGRFDPEDALALMESLLDRALADGFHGMRVSGEGSGPVTDDVWASVMRYEALVNERFARRPYTGLCRFDACSVPPARLDDTLRTHPQLLVRGELCTNPFYERPEVALSTDAHARVHWRLHQVRAHNRALRKLEARVAAGAPRPQRG